MFQENPNSPIEQKPSILDSIDLQLLNSNGSDELTNGSDEHSLDPNQKHSKLEIDGGSVISEGRSSVDSSNGQLILDEHKNGDIEENESSSNQGDFNSKVIESIQSEDDDKNIRDVLPYINQIEREINNLDYVLVAKEMEWNAILRLKKLKELLMDQLRREDEISSLLEQTAVEGNDLKKLLNEVIQENRNINNIESQSKISSNRIRTEISKVETEIAEGTGRKYRRLLPKSSLIQFDQRSASKALQKLSEKNSSNNLLASPSSTPSNESAKQGPKGPLVQVTSLIADYRRAKRKQEITSTGNKSSKTPKTTNVQISYSDVLLSLAKISSNECKASSPDLSGGANAQNKGSTTRGNNTIKSNITLAKLLTTVGTGSNSSNSRSDEVKTSGDDFKGRHNSSISSETHISLSNLLASNQKVPKELYCKNKARNEQPTKSETVPICQGCNSNQAQFVCAGCGNQWYCSRDCQVEAWDEHAESCSG